MLARTTTNFTDEWGNSSDWYQANWDGGVYEGKIYGIWGWTDIRGIWYWKDLLKQADVDPELLKTWNGYINASKRLNEILRPYGIEGMHLVGASHAPDMFYPYLWMLGGEIFEMKNGHPKHGSYWFPTFNSSEGVMALEFIKRQIDAGQLAIKFAHHVSHLPERMGLFVIIVLGESILGVVVGLAGHEWDIYSSLSVGLGLSIPFSLWWIYFDNIGGSAIRAATEKGKRGIYYIWLYVHFPLVVGLTAIGIGIKQVAASNQEILYLFQIFGLFVVQYPAVCLFRQYFIW
jgi:hypothetical protein